MSKPSSDFEADIGKKYSIGKVTVIIEGVLAEGEEWLLYGRPLKW